jgi:hypothetical protein
VEASLVPLIRCAMHRGVGLPGLVQWVRTTLPGLSERERTAPGLARQLCANLLRQYEPNAHRIVSFGDTVAMG